MRVDFPALGMPTMATSATSLSSRSSQRSSPRSPCSAKAGARRRLLRKCALPWPPRPPEAASHRCDGADRSASTVPSRSRTTVPTGTGTSRSLPRAPCRRLPPPWPPLPARRWGWSRKASNEDWLSVVTSHTSPPCPPSPPSGPPLLTWASRRNATAPAPPSPARAWSCASSTNPAMTQGMLRASRPGKGMLRASRPGKGMLRATRPGKGMVRDGPVPYSAGPPPP